MLQCGDETPAGPTFGCRRRSTDRRNHRGRAAAPATAPRDATEVRRWDPESGAPSPEGSGRRFRPRKCGQAGVVAMRCSQVRTDDLPPRTGRGLPGPQVGLRTRSSASCSEPVNAVAVRQQFAPVTLCVGDEHVRRRCLLGAHSPDRAYAGPRQPIVTLFTMVTPSGPAEPTASRTERSFDGVGGSGSSTTPGHLRATVRVR